MLRCTFLGWLLVLVIAGCDKKAKQDMVAFDPLLGRVDRIDLNDELRENDHRRSLTQDQFSRVIASLQPSNRVSYTFWHKSFGSGTLILHQGTSEVARLGYFPREGVLHYRAYTFALKDRSVMTNLFTPMPPDTEQNTVN
jgi:hypothetical protein